MYPHKNSNKFGRSTSFFWGEETWLEKERKVSQLTHFVDIFEGRGRGEIKKNPVFWKYSFKPCHDLRHWHFDVLPPNFYSSVIFAGWEAGHQFSFEFFLTFFLSLPRSKRKKFLRNFYPTTQILNRQRRFPLRNIGNNFSTRVTSLTVFVVFVLFLFCCFFPYSGKRVERKTRIDSFLLEFQSFCVEQRVLLLKNKERTLYFFWGKGESRDAKCYLEGTRI